MRHFDARTLVRTGPVAEFGEPRLELARELKIELSQCFADKYFTEGKGMLETIIVILLVLWLVGLVAGQTFGGILHVLLLVAVVVFVIRLLTGRTVV